LSNITHHVAEGVTFLDQTWSKLLAKKTCLLNHNPPGRRKPFSSMATVRRRVEPATFFF